MKQDSIIAEIQDSGSNARVALDLMKYIYASNRRIENPNDLPIKSQDEILALYARCLRATHPNSL